MVVTSFLFWRWKRYHSGVTQECQNPTAKESASVTPLYPRPQFPLFLKDPLVSGLFLLFSPLRIASAAPHATITTS